MIRGRKSGANPNPLTLCNYPTPSLGGGSPWRANCDVGHQRNGSVRWIAKKALPLTRSVVCYRLECYFCYPSTSSLNDTTTTTTAVWITSPPFHYQHQSYQQISATMNAEGPPEFLLEAFADPNTVRDVVRGRLPLFIPVCPSIL